MADEMITRALAALGCRTLENRPVELAGSMSQSGVYRLRVDGQDAVLKVTTNTAGQDLGRRELTFYRTLASEVPVKTPSLLRYANNEDLTALLLSAHSPARPAKAWDRSAWLEVARQLAALHSTPLPAGNPWDEVSWLLRVLNRPPVHKAKNYWSRTDAADHLAGVLGAAPGLRQALDTVPDCFIHGDCHVDNLLWDGDDIVWSDWQGAMIGNPAAELAFLWGRAHSDGADLPREEMLREYTTRRGIDPDAFHRAATAAELSIILFAFPDYAEYRTPDEEERVTQRLVQLIDSWRQLTAQV